MSGDFDADVAGPEMDPLKDKALAGLGNADENVGYHARYANSSLAASLGEALEHHHPGQELAYKVTQDSLDRELGNDLNSEMTMKQFDIGGLSA